MALAQGEEQLAFLNQQMDSLTILKIGPAPARAAPAAAAAASAAAAPAAAAPAASPPKTRALPKGKGSVYRVLGSPDAPCVQLVLEKGDVQRSEGFVYIGEALACGIMDKDSKDNHNAAEAYKAGVAGQTRKLVIPYPYSTKGKGDFFGWQAFKNHKFGTDKFYTFLYHIDLAALVAAGKFVIADEEEERDTDKCDICSNECIIAEMDICDDCLTEYCKACMPHKCKDE